MNLCTYELQTVSGLAVGETRDDSKEFEYDHSYWSVDTSDSHFTSQEQVWSTLKETNTCMYCSSQCVLLIIC